MGQPKLSIKFPGSNKPHDDLGWFQKISEHVDVAVGCDGDEDFVTVLNKTNDNNAVNRN